MSKKKLNKSDVLAIKQALTEGASQLAVAKQYKVSRSLISDIATGRTHTDVGGDVPPKKRGGQYRKISTHSPEDIRVQELEAEVVHLREERDYARRAAKAGSKQYGLFKAMVEELEGRIQPLPTVPKLWTPPKRKDIIQEHVVLHLSDAHADEIVRPTEVGGLEEYDFNIACARAERLVESTIEWCTETLKPRFHFPVLWVLANGDMTSGEIHGAAPRSHFRNQIKNCLAIGTLKAMMLRDLAPHFPQINVVCVSGNHGRRTIQKDFNAPTDSWDTLISNVARLQCTNLDNVDFLIPEAYSVNLEINGVGFNLSHGDDVRSNGGIPWYAMIRRQKNLLALGAMQGGLPIRYHAIGHHHTMSSLSDLNGELLVNGSWLATNSYSYNSFAGYREPQQLLHGVNSTYGITWKLGIKMKHDGERDGPKRYKIEGAEEVQAVRK